MQKIATIFRVPESSLAQAYPLCRVPFVISHLGYSQRSQVIYSLHFCLSWTQCPAQYFLVCDHVAPQLKSLQWCPHQWCPHLVLSEHRAVPELIPSSLESYPLLSPHLLRFSHAASSLVPSHHQNPTFQLLPLLVLLPGNPTLPPRTA